MAISAVSSVSFRNNYNNIQFEGRKKGKKSNDGAQHRHSSTPVKAASLAAVMLMSPLNTSSANNVAILSGNNIEYVDNGSVIESKRFDIDGFSAKVSLVKDVNNPQINRIWLDFDIDDYNGVNGYVTELNHVNYNIKGDDNRLYSNVIFDNIYVEDFGHRLSHSSSFSNPDIVNYVKQLVASGTVDISTKNINIDLTPTMEGWLVLKDAVDSSWLVEAKKHGQMWGNSIGTWEIDTSDGVYRVFANDTDGNQTNFEEVAIQKENGPTLQVRGIVGAEAKFETLDNDIRQVDLPQIVVRKKGIGNHSMYNTQLWEFLVGLYQNGANNDAIEGTNASYTYDIKKAACPTVIK